jgi:ribulose-5-phosphate 4-epimerase/fuculose-1-phosphate aldolase
MDEKIKSDLAYGYKILYHLGLDDHTYTHLSSRSSNKKSYYIYPFGLRFEEVTPDNLIRVSFDGEIIEGSEYQYNKTGYIIHGNIYKARDDINSVFHIHTPAIVAVSAYKKGLLQLSQWALHFYNKISYHNYDSLSLDNDQGIALVRDLGDNYTMLMRNHGSVTCGRTIWEALFYTYHLEMACKTQVMANYHESDMIIPSKEICEKAVQDLLGFEKDLGLRDWKAWLRKLL